MKLPLKMKQQHAEVWALIDFICFYDKDVIKWAVIYSFPEWEGQKHATCWKAPAVSQLPLFISNHQYLKSTYWSCLIS